jgi:tight adherence protein C
VVVCAAMMLSGRWPVVRLAPIVLVVAVLGIVPAAAVIAFVAMGIALRRARVKTARSRRDDIGAALAIDVISLGVSAGLPFSSAAELAAATSGGAAGTDIARALRAVPGSSSEVTFRSGALETVFSAATRSAQTGASLGPLLEAVGSDLRDERAAAVRERLSRLPVKLLFPLAFLILPGFVLLAVAPAVVGGLSRLGI